MAKSVTRTDGFANDRLTRVCEAAIQAAEASVDYRDGDQIIVLMDSEAERKGGFVLHGYDTPRAGLKKIMGHAEAICVLEGLRFEMTIDD